jgi:hypothetical protein
MAISIGDTHGKLVAVVFTDVPEEVLQQQQVWVG